MPLRTIKNLIILHLLLIFYLMIFYDDILISFINFCVKIVSCID